MTRKSSRLFAFVLAATLLALPAMAKDGALSLVPSNAVTVGMVKLSDMRTSPLSGMLFQQTDKFSADGDAAKFLADAGLDVTKDVDTIVVATVPQTALGSEADVLVAAEGRFNVERLTSALIARGAVKKGNYLLPPDDSKDNEGRQGAVAFPSAQLAIAGTEKAVVAALAARTNGGTGFPTASNLGAQLRGIYSNATAWALVDVPRVQRLTGAPRVPSGKSGSHDALAAAIKSVSTVALWATDTGDSLKLGAFGLSNDTETLQLLEDTIRGALSAVRLAVREKAPEMVSMLRRFDVSRTDDSVTITGSLTAATLRDLTSKVRGNVASAK
jgi:hypothetical protein